MLLHGSSICAVEYAGVNLAGAEFGESQLPGTYGTHYTYPSSAEIDYYRDAGMNVIRLPFRWERLQRSLYGELDGSELARLSAVVAHATSKGVSVLLDPHNYARYHGNPIGSAAVPNAAFADFWARVAQQFAGNPRVLFGLMNEPHSMATEQWLAAANAAIGAIRLTGAQNLILVPGNAWTGAHSWSQSWYGTPNATVMRGIVDPADHFAFEVHQYLDPDSSGTSAQISSATIGSERLASFTAWLRSNGYRGFLGEFAVAGSTIGAGIGDEALSNMLAYLDAHSDVWIGWTFWAGGPWWGEYLFTLEPKNLGQANQIDRPQLAVMAPHLLPEPTSALVAGIALVCALAGLRRHRAPR